MHCRNATTFIRPARRRGGTAVVELALCLPLLTIIALGSIEATNAIFLKQHLTSAAYEAARSATAPGRTSAQATAAAEAVLTQFKITGGTITISPAVNATTPSGTKVTVTVTAPLGANACMSSFIIGKSVSKVAATVVMDHQ